MVVSDARLVELARGGSGDAAGALFDRYWPIAWKTAYGVTADRSLADEVAQEAVQRAFGALDRFDPTRPFAPWLKRIVVNRALDELRARRALESLDEREPVRDAAIEVSPDDELRLWAVADAVAALSQPKRLVVVLRYWLDFPPDEIAELLEVPVGTVWSRLSRAHDELRERLKEHFVA